MLNIAHFQHISQAAGFDWMRQFLSILSKSKHLDNHHSDKISKGVAPRQEKRFDGTSRASQAKV
jgi:hypothetical protein